MDHHLAVVRLLEWLSDPKTLPVVFFSKLLVGSPMPNWSWGRGLTENNPLFCVGHTTFRAEDFNSTSQRLMCLGQPRQGQPLTLLFINSPSGSCLVQMICVTVCVHYTSQLAPGRKHGGGHPACSKPATWICVIPIYTPKSPAIQHIAPGV